jgi:hypothetical protein
MEFIKIQRSHGYFKKISNRSNSSLTQSEYKPIIDKLDIANPEDAGSSVDAIFLLLIKKNPDIENNPEFRNIKNGITAEIFKMGDKYDKALRESLKSTPENVKDNTAEIKNFEHIKNEMFELVKKFYKSGYKIIAYDIMRQLSILSKWMDDAINKKDADENKHKIKEIFSSDSDFHKSFLYLNKIKSLLRRKSLKDELAKFSTEIHRNENGQVVDIEKCIKEPSDAGSAVGSFFGLCADKGSKIINNYVSDTIIGRDYDKLKEQNPLSSISTIKDRFIEVDKKCNITREANGKVGIFDIENKSATQEYKKDKQKRFNDFKTMVLNIFENKEKYDGEKYKLNNKLTDFFFEKIPSNDKDAIQWGNENDAKNIIKLFKAVVTEGGMKGFHYIKCERIADRVKLDELINDLTSKLNAIAPETEKVKKCLYDFIAELNGKLSMKDVTFLKSKKGQFFLKQHKGFNALSDVIKRITGEMSSGFDFITNGTNGVIQISNSFEKWHDEQVKDLKKDKKFLQQIASPRDEDKPIDSSKLIGNLSPQDIKEGMKKYVPWMFERNIKENQFIRQAQLDAKRQKMLLNHRLANDEKGNGYYPPEGTNFYQNQYLPHGIYPQQQRLSDADINRIADVVDRRRIGTATEAQKKR